MIFIPFAIVLFIGLFVTMLVVLNKKRYFFFPKGEMCVHNNNGNNSVCHPRRCDMRERKPDSV